MLVLQPKYYPLRRETPEDRWSFLMNPKAFSYARVHIHMFPDVW